MHLNIDLDLLNLLKKDNMINDFQIVADSPLLSKYEKELVQDISNISTAIHHADNGQGNKKDITLNF